MKGFLDYIPGNSVLHKLNPLTKMLLSLGICASCFISSSYAYLLGMIALNLLLGLLGGIFKTAFKMLVGLSKISIFLFVLQIFFVRTGTILIQFPLHIYITDDGIFFAFLVVLRLIGATMPLALMLSLTQMNDLSNVLVSKLRIPYKYAFTLTTAIRFIPVLAEEMAGIMEAQTARGVEFDTRNPFRKIGLILPLCVPLLIASVKKTDASAISAELRGFHLRTGKSSSKSYTVQYADFLTVLFLMIMISGAVFTG
ncbi:MAG: energy-coupling factor transporter transmembrane protein EcfT [Clostridiales bacterium]|nr:energy-coupling factor transporter transmembrane protein EcfT [Clostridiales bacterium]